MSLRFFEKMKVYVDQLVYINLISGWGYQDKHGRVIEVGLFKISWISWFFKVSDFFVVFLSFGSGG